MAKLTWVGRAVSVCSLAAAYGCGDNIKEMPNEEGILQIAKRPLETTEAGGKDSFEVQLIGMPRQNFEVVFTSSNPDEGRVDVQSHMFTRHTWDVPVVVTVTGVDDDYDDRDQLYEIVVDGGEFGRGEVAAANRDLDVFGATVTPTTGLETSEAGTTASFTVKLTSKPYGNVTIPMSSTVPAEGALSAPSLSFTSLNWNAAQTVVVTGVDDSVADDRSEEHTSELQSLAYLVCR